MTETNTQLAAFLTTLADDIVDNGEQLIGESFVRNFRLAAQRLESREISDAKMKAAAAGLLKTGFTVFAALTPSELEEAARAALEAAQKGETP